MNTRVDEDNKKVKDLCKIKKVWRFSRDYFGKNVGFIISMTVTGPRSGSLGYIVCTGGLSSEGVRAVWSRR